MNPSIFDPKRVSILKLIINLRTKILNKIFYCFETSINDNSETDLFKVRGIIVLKFHIREILHIMVVQDRRDELLILFSFL